tara:strand:+ start:1253 stop:1870 length:618 start_codon:yes stop_codon:yes gene_type:complete
LTEKDQRSERIRAAMAGHQGDESQARALLTASDVATRRVALGALDRIGSLTSSELQSALKDPSGSVRRRALEIAAKRSDVKIEVCLNDSDPAVAEAAAFAIGERTEISAVPSLIRMASQHDDPLCRESAIAALGALATVVEDGRKEILNSLLEAMNDKPQIRRRAVLGLFQFDEPEAQQALNTALVDKDRQVRAVTGDLLGVATD